MSEINLQNENELLKTNIVILKEAIDDYKCVIEIIKNVIEDYKKLTTPSYTVDVNRGIPSSEIKL